MRSSVLALGVLACSGDEPHDCDAGTPTCQSSLVVLLPDERPSFLIRVQDELGMDLTVECPLDASTAPDFGAYTVTCGAGRLTLETNLRFGDSVSVTLEASAPVEFDSSDYQMGGDFCGNACTVGTLQLP